MGGIVNVIGYGIDVSHHQDPAHLPWVEFAGQVDFVIARANYGARLRDRHCPEHIRRARDIGAKVGLYSFFRNVHGITEQFDLLCAVAEECGIGPGDIVPTIDIEADSFDADGHTQNRPVDPSWSEPARQLANLLAAQFGDCMIYLTQREFGQLGKPDWALNHPLWVAHYGARMPALPGNMPATIWQHRVAPFVKNGPSLYDKASPVLDQNFQLLPLPLIPPSITDADRERTAGLVALTTQQSADEALHGESFPLSDTEPSPSESA